VALRFLRLQLATHRGLAAFPRPRTHLCRPEQMREAYRRGATARRRVNYLDLLGGLLIHECQGVRSPKTWTLKALICFNKDGLRTCAALGALGGSCPRAETCDFPRGPARHSFAREPQPAHARRLPPRPSERIDAPMVPGWLVAERCVLPPAGRMRAPCRHTHEWRGVKQTEGNDQGITLAVRNLCSTTQRIPLAEIQPF